ncbi:MAG: hypothetical protein ACREDR_41205, partial [Blastocatellia bacterium]
MKKRMVAALMMFSLVAALAVTNAVGAGTPHTPNLIKVDVPFDFSDGATAFPAGRYSIQPFGVDFSTAGITIASDDGKAHGTRLVFPAGSPSPKSETALVFRRYGDRYFLSQVWINSNATSGLQLSTSSSERAVEREVK